MTVSELKTGVFPGLAPRLLAGGLDRREGAEEYVAGGGYGSAGLAGEELIEAIEAAGLRGRGGAAFPTGMKMRSVRDRGGPRYLVVNGEEGEPASIKDRWLLCRRPHLVLDGALRAAAAIGAERLHLFVSDRAAEAGLRTALGEREEWPLPIRVDTTAPAYVAGEETAVVRSINGGPALPVDKPPRPFEAGVDGAPTLVVNVETAANLPLIAIEGAAAFRAVGESDATGTFLATLTGAVARPGLYELPLGAVLGEAVDAVAGLPEAPSGFLMGGFFAGLLGPRGIGVRLAYDELREEGSGLGCGAIVVLGPEECPVAVAIELMEYFERENADQCGACIRGTTAMLGALRALGAAAAGEGQIGRLEGWSMSLKGRGACAFLDGAATLAGTLLREFPAAVGEHLDGDGCTRCAAVDHLPGTRFATSMSQFEKGASIR